jgi:hypothetical protein
MTNLSKSDLLNNELAHTHGGIGWATVEIIDDDYVRVMDKSAIRHQAFLAAVSHLSIRKPLSPEDYEVLNPVREGLANGTSEVIGSHILSVSTPPH